MSEIDVLSGSFVLCDQSKCGDAGGEWPKAEISPAALWLDNSPTRLWLDNGRVLLGSGSVCLKIPEFKFIFVVLVQKSF